MGRRHGLFPHVIVGSGPLLYAAELSNGMLKVGYTANARIRLNTLGTTVRKDYDAEILSFHVGCTLPSEAEARRLEQQLIEHVRRSAANHGTSYEFFSAGNYEFVCGLVDAISSGEELDLPRTTEEAAGTKVYIGRRDGLFTQGVEVIDFYAAEQPAVFAKAA